MVAANDPGRDAGYNTTIRNVASNHSVGCDHNVSPNLSAGENHGPGADPATGSDANGLVTGNLVANRYVEAFIAVVLIGDVYVHANEHVVADVDPQMTNDRCTAADEATVPDADHGVSRHRLTGQDPSRERYIG